MGSTEPPTNGTMPWGFHATWKYRPRDEIKSLFGAKCPGLAMMEQLQNATSSRAAPPNPATWRVELTELHPDAGEIHSSSTLTNMGVPLSPKGSGSGNA